PIVIAVALDGRYAPWAATLVRSCLRANPLTSMCFEIVHDRTLSDEDRAGLAESATSNHSSFRFHAVASDNFSDLPSTPLFGSVVWLRFCLPDLLPDRSRVIYQDSDTLVMSDLHELWGPPLAHASSSVERTEHLLGLASVGGRGVRRSLPRRSDQTTGDPPFRRARPLQALALLVSLSGTEGAPGVLGRDTLGRHSSRGQNCRDVAPQTVPWRAAVPRLRSIVA